MGRERGHVAVDRLERALLVAGRRERQAVAQPALGQRRRAVERPPPSRQCGAARGGAAGRAGAAAARRRPGAAGPPGASPSSSGKVDGGQRRRPVRQPLVDAQRGRAAARARRCSAPACSRTMRQDLRRGDPLRGRVVGDLPLPRHGLARRRVRLDREGVAAPVLAVEHEPRAGLVLALQPRLVEERDLHRAGGVGHGRLDERPHSATADGARADRPDLHDHGGGLARDQRGHGARLAAVVRQVLEQVADRLQPERAQPLRRGLRGRSQRRGQPRRRAASARAPPRASRGREARRSRSCGGRGPLLPV